jgi:hypothetical protein
MNLGNPHTFIYKNIYMKKILILLLIFTTSCSVSNYPIVTRYKEPNYRRVHYVKVKPEKEHKVHKVRNWELAVFTVGTILLYTYIENVE